ncbi:exonuclease subunit SbcC [Myxosarcina sp. GI1]|uniref:exonuclease subunit SbcC n=1 Tax=Myxosarcina sp. GI1 TaxID=1541065 RepID=UPI000561B10B|nr:exonuclease subunit SbcC [Myxosarcina sp. GI1]
MIPLQLTLKNFLSYRNTSLNFRGLHTACICGANGAGKSSLLEAITWAIWGKSRAATEDDVIHGGANNVRVDFDFIYNDRTYRIIRSRPRGRSSSLEFQVETESGRFRSLTAKGLKATQDEINACLKLDYDTFINSAYLRQGRADEFMLRRPSERKQILADLLKLDRYEELASQAKEIARDYKIKIEQTQQSLAPLETELAKRKEIEAQIEQGKQQITQLQKLQESDRARLQQIQAVEYQRQSWEQQIGVRENQYQNLVKDCDRATEDITGLQSKLEQLAKLLQRETEITKGYEQLLKWQTAEKDLSAKLDAHQQAQQQKQQLERQLVRQQNAIALQVSQIKTRIEAIEQQEGEIHKTVARSEEVAEAVAKLNKHRQRLQELDRIQQYVSPLLQQRNNLQTKIEREEARLYERLERLQTSAQQLALDIQTVPEKRDRLLTVDARIEDLDKKKVYQKRVEEKGNERKEFRSKLQENHRLYERQKHELQQKLEMLAIPDAACPLCQQELDRHHRDRVIDKTRKQQQEIEEQMWVIREQLTTSDRELQLLRQEYQQISREIVNYDSLQQQLGQLEAQLEATEEIYDKLQATKEEKDSLENSLRNGNYAVEFQTQIKQLDTQIKQLNYDEQTHALIRGEVNNLRWAEIKQAKIEDARSRQEKLDRQKPELLKQITELQTQLDKLPIDSEIQQQINDIERQIKELGYNRTIHQNILASLRQAQSWQFKHQELQQAKQEYPQLQKKLQELESLLRSRLQDKNTARQQLDNYIAQKNQIDDYRSEIQQLDLTIHQRRQQLDELISQSGRLQQTISQIDNLKTKYQEKGKQLKEYEKQFRIYQELTQAFGKNGIQALTIENVLPQLEAETNQILARLTGNQFHVQFLTQKASKNRSKKKTKLIDTLDILIADAGGTRPYETYSGGEAFRINFSVRLALAKLLAQRAGTALQMLIVDEGFGTQDAEGCERLVAAINAIASDFACILTVTHMPQFKEAFQTRIEVYKGDRGSQLRVSN